MVFHRPKSHARIIHEIEGAGTGGGDGLNSALFLTHVSRVMIYRARSEVASLKLTNSPTDSRRSAGLVRLPPVRKLLHAINTGMCHNLQILDPQQSTEPSGGIVRFGAVVI